MWMYCVGAGLVAWIVLASAMAVVLGRVIRRADTLNERRRERRLTVVR